MPPTERDLAAAARKVVAAERRVDAALKERDGLIRAALEAGIGPTQVAKATGLAVQRIHQIRRGSRI